ncbi:MAG: hypothetical protein ACFB01_15215 [Cohaesibacteraceae bacterium]
MKRLTALTPLLLLPSVALAHGSGPAHAHPHSDWTVMLILGAVVALAAIVVLRRSGSDTKEDD